jgi:hypothetical protein
VGSGIATHFIEFIASKKQFIAKEKLHDIRWCVAVLITFLISRRSGTLKQHLLALLAAGVAKRRCRVRDFAGKEEAHSGRDRHFKRITNSFRCAGARPATSVE